MRNSLLLIDLIISIKQYFKNFFFYLFFYNKIILFLFMVINYFICKLFELLQFFISKSLLIIYKIYFLTKINNKKLILLKLYNIFYSISSSFFIFRV